MWYVFYQEEGGRLVSLADEIPASLPPGISYVESGEDRPDLKLWDAQTHMFQAPEPAPEPAAELETLELPLETTVAPEAEAEEPPAPSEESVEPTEADEEGRWPRRHRR